MSLNTRITRLNADGTPDESFDPGTGLNGAGRAVAVLPTGQIIVGGSFTEVGGLERAHVAILEEDGGLAETRADADGPVHFLLAQTDGRVLVGGDFSEIQDVQRQHLVRLKEDLVLEAAFDPSLDAPAYAGALQGDGAIYIGGDFTTVRGDAYSRLARLYNQEATGGLEVQNSSRVTWKRSGARGEATQVTFELSTDAGATWTALPGTPVRTQGDWDLSGLTLSGNGQVRARAFPGNGHSGCVDEEVLAFDFVPEIQVMVGETVLPSGVLTVQDFGSVPVGAVATVKFTVRNVGLLPLELTGTPNLVAITEATDGSGWSVVQPFGPEDDAVIQPRQFVEFTVQFAPGSEWNKTATLTLPNNDSDEGGYHIRLAGFAEPGPGSRDFTFQPQVNGEVFALASGSQQVLAGGKFTTVNARAYKFWSRLTHGDALVDAPANLRTRVSMAAMLPDGRMMVVRDGNTTTSRLMRLLPDGKTDSSFKSPIPNTGLITNMVVQADGAVILGGAFTVKVGGENISAPVRLRPDGALDVTWRPTAAWRVYGMALQADGKLILSGQFIFARGEFGTGTVIKRVIRLHESGVLDATFNEQLPTGTFSSQGGLVSVTADDKILVHAVENTIVGTGSMLRRLNADGTLDSGWTAFAARGIRTLVQQADGGIILGYTENGDRLVRLLADGTADTSFVPLLTNLKVNGVGLSPEGRVYIGGDFTLNGKMQGLARLINQKTATSQFSVLDRERVQWLRGGTAPEAQDVALHLSENLGQNWTYLGRAQRTSGGWQHAELDLPTTGLLRATARTVGGYGCGSSGLMEVRQEFRDLHAPDLKLMQVDTTIAPGGNIQFLPSLPGRSGELVLTVENAGKHDPSRPNPLLLQSLTVRTTSSDKPAAALDWQLASSPTDISLAPGERVSLIIRFTPSAIGYSTGQLVITSNVPGAKKTCTYTLRGSGIAQPVATTQVANSITATVAKLRGQVKPNHDVAKAWFEYKRTNASDWIRVPTTEFTTSGFTSVQVEQVLSGLLPGTAYHYRVGVYNSFNTVSSPAYGAISGFTTLPF
jgi:uncharacterized delta-60 repeat protein